MNTNAKKREYSRFLPFYVLCVGTLCYTCVANVTFACYDIEKYALLAK